MLPKAGKNFRASRQSVGAQNTFARIIAEALCRTLDDSHRAVKTVMLWTGASERTVKNWLAGTHGPQGDFLLFLLGKSDAVLDAIIATLPTDRLMGLTARLLRKTGAANPLVVPLDLLVWNDRLPGHRHRSATSAQSTAGRPPNDPLGGPDPVPTARADPPLNGRQVWFLNELHSGGTPRAHDLHFVYGVSEKTAKRDIADLRRRKLIRFVGTRRRGYYTFLRVDSTS